MIISHVIITVDLFQVSHVYVFVTPHGKRWTCVLLIFT